MIFQINKLVTWYLVISIIYSPFLFAAGADLESPVINHKTATQVIKGGKPIKMIADVTDNVGVKSVTLYYKTEGMENYRTLEMGLDGNETRFTAVIPGAEVETSKLEYYIQAVDVNGNTVTRGGRNFPLHIALSAPPATGAEDSGDGKGESSYTWLWVVGGLLLGAAALSGSDDGGDDDQGKTGTISFAGPDPQ